MQHADEQIRDAEEHRVVAEAPGTARAAPNIAPIAPRIDQPDATFVDVVALVSQE